MEEVPWRQKRKRRRKHWKTAHRWLSGPLTCNRMIPIVGNDSTGSTSLDGIGGSSYRNSRTVLVESTTTIAAVVYVLSGICQPLLMTECTNAGLADSQAQLYMLFYYAGPSGLLFTLLPCGRCSAASNEYQKVLTSRPSASPVIKACFIAGFDIAAQSLNFAGASLAGATVFAVVYSSVTVWTAIYSRFFYGRVLSTQQCLAILLVVVGFCITALDSVNLGRDVARGTAYVILGSCMHGATYVMSEAIMSKHSDAHTLSKERTSDVTTATVCTAQAVKRDLLTVRENSAIQGCVACGGLLIWQLFFTIPRWDARIRQPMQQAGTTTLQATFILVAFGVANLLHSFSFYHTLAHYPGGSTSAGVMKGLQAVLVFVAAHILYCTKTETGLCFSSLKFASLVTVVSGVVIYSSNTGSIVPATAKASYASVGYTQLGNATIESTHEGPV